MLKCPSCGSVSFVSTGAGQEKIPGAPSVDTRNTDQTPNIRRRRRCTKCNHLLSTREYEVEELQAIMLGVKKESGDLEGSEKHLASIATEVADLLEELLSWAGQVNKHKKQLKKRKDL